MGLSRTEVVAQAFVDGDGFEEVLLSIVALGRVGGTVEGVAETHVGLGYEGVVRTVQVLTDGEGFTLDVDRSRVGRVREAMAEGRECACERFAAVAVKLTREACGGFERWDRIAELPE